MKISEIIDRLEKIKANIGDMQAYNSETGELISTIICHYDKIYIE